MTPMEDKIGVFICSGYGIAEALDIDALCTVATDEFSVPFCKIVDSCEGSGLEAINQDIRTEGLTKVVIAGISPRRFADNAFPDGVIVEPVGLREQVVWSHPRAKYPVVTEEQKDDGIHFDSLQMLAEDYLKMGMVKVTKIDLPEPYKVETFTRKILVIGGGVAGISAALDHFSSGPTRNGSSRSMSRRLSQAIAVDDSLRVRRRASPCRT